jgi:hypothetical protein
MESVYLGESIGAGKKAEVFDAGAHVLKLYRSEHSKSSAFYEGAVLAVVESLELPAPSVLSIDQIGKRRGIKMSKATGHPYANQMRDIPGRAEAIADMARLHQLVHSKSGRNLPSQKVKLASNIGLALELGDAVRNRLLDGLAVLADDVCLCHGDFHPFNIIGEVGNGIIVDWLDACHGTPAADVCRSFVLMTSFDKQIAEEYLQAYCQAADLGPAAIGAWLPFVAAARLAEGVPAETEWLLSIAEAV